MLKRIAAISSSRWTIAILGITWLLSLLYMIDRGWVWESWEAVPGGVEHRSNYFDIRRTPTFIWLTLIVFGYAAYFLRLRFLGYYGLVEIIFGLVGGFIAVYKLPLNEPTAWFSLGAVAYIMVRGATNIAQAVAAQDAAATPTK
jgi:hypothetical protein